MKVWKKIITWHYRDCASHVRLVTGGIVTVIIAEQNSLSKFET